MKYIPILLLFLSTPAYAEVSDKMPSMYQLWLYSAIGFIVILFLVRWSLWFIVLAVLSALFFGTASYETFADPYIGPAIIKEQGLPYIVSSYSMCIFIIIGTITGSLLHIKNKHITSKSSSPAKDTGLDRPKSGRPLT
ncbi:MAG: hypothetical protein OEZ33_12055 [Gammaproteobacteria bacterium]|nr:hypothetical protein [Gammaproteobacteria bacterium]MDH5778941.1 hypothetical protein [Gammaproteobacteria bacterium]